MLGDAREPSGRRRLPGVTTKSGQTLDHLDDLLPVEAVPPGEL